MQQHAHQTIWVVLGLAQPSLQIQRTVAAAGPIFCGYLAISRAGSAPAGSHFEHSTDMCPDPVTAGAACGSGRPAHPGLQE